MQDSNLQPLDSKSPALPDWANPVNLEVNVFTIYLNIPPICLKLKIP